MLLILACVLSVLPFSAFGTEGEEPIETPDTRASQSVVQEASALKATIQSLPSSGSEVDGRVDLTGFANTNATGDPIYGLRGKYYVAYLPDSGTAEILDGSWGTAVGITGTLPTVSVSVSGNSLTIGNRSNSIAFTILPADIFSGTGRHTFAFSTTAASATVLQLGAIQDEPGISTVKRGTSMEGTPRILLNPVEGENTLTMTFSFSNSEKYTFQNVSSNSTPAFGWNKTANGDATHFALYRIWSTVKLRKAISNATYLLSSSDSYAESEYENFLACMKEGVKAFQDYNALPTALIAPYVYPQETLDRLAEEIESYITLLSETKNYIDIPVEIIDFRSDGYLFENTAFYAFRYDKNDVDNTALSESVRKEIQDRFMSLPELPGALRQPIVSGTAAQNMREGLTAPTLVDGKLVYDPKTISYMATLLCIKQSNSRSSLTYFVAGRVQTLGQFIDATFYTPYNKSNATAETKAKILGSWDETLDKIGGVNGNPLLWSQVETAHDAAYYLLTYLWEPVPENDTFYYKGSSMSPDTSLTDQKYNRYNMVVTERDTLRLYGDSKNGYILDSRASKNEMGYSGRYIFNSGKASDVLKVTKPGFAPIDGLGFEAPGVMVKNFDTDPGSGRVVLEGHNSYDSNYNFSMHAYGSFIYYEDQNLYFEFTGDDDVYFFVDEKLALDIGSSHVAMNGRCDLNQLGSKGINLVEGQIYTFDMFYTERATPDANLFFKTNIKIVDDQAFTSKGQYMEHHGMVNRVNSTTGMGVELEENAMVAIGDTVGYSFELLNTRTVPLTNVSFTDTSLGVDISKDSLKLCDSTNNYALTNGAKTLITDIVVTYRTYNSNKVNEDNLTMLSYSSMLSKIRQVTAEPTGSATQFTQLDPGSYGVRISSEGELKTLLELGIPVNCQMAVYGFKRTMVKEDLPYQNTVQSLAYYKRVTTEGTGLVYGDPIPVSGTATRTIRVPDVSAITPPTADAERYVIDYNKPVDIPIEDLTKHVYTNNYVSSGELLGFVADGTNGAILRRIPQTLYCDKASGSKTLETSYGTVTRSGNTLTYTLDGFLSDIDRFYAVIAIIGMYAKGDDGQKYEYPCILVEVQVIPATNMYYETDLASEEFTTAAPNQGIFFDFKNEAADQTRYNSAPYGYANFDLTDKKRWLPNSAVTDVQVNNAEEGTLSYTCKYVSQSTTGYYVETTTSGGRTYPLHYELTGNDVFQIRFKTENLVSFNDGHTIGIHPTMDDTKTIIDACKTRQTFDSAYLSNGKYHTVTIPLKKSCYDYTYISSFRVYLGAATTPSEDATGSITIDYIYVGPADTVPVGEHLYFDFTNRQSDIDRYDSKLYGNGTFYNYDTVPTWRQRSKTMSGLEVDHNVGTLTLISLDQAALDANNHELYVQASNKISSNFYMNYHPKEGDVLKVRFRLINATQAKDSTGKLKNMNVRVVTFAGRKETTDTPLIDLKGQSYSYTFPKDGLVGNYTEVTYKLWTKEAYRTELMTAFRLNFSGISIQDPSAGPAKVEIDYIYIGTEADFSHMDRLYGQSWQVYNDGTDHAGEKQESDFADRTVFDMEKCGEDQRFFVDFNNTDDDLERYALPAYGGLNPDTIDPWRNAWKLSEYSIDNNAGLMKWVMEPEIDDSYYPDVYVTMYDLDYDPQYAEVFQMRFKLENFVLGDQVVKNNDGSTTTNKASSGYIDLHYNYDPETDTWGRGAINNDLKTFNAKYLSNGQFVTVTVVLTEEFRNADTIDSIRPYIAGLESPGDGSSGIAYIDYIYIGPRDRAPADTVYGYDASYGNDTKLSNGSSLYVEGVGVRVDGTETNYTETEFSFTGTGFDIISRTGAEQGTIRISVFSDPERTKLVKALTVNNKGELELYQIPVASIQALPHGTYYVTIGVNKKISGSPLAMLNRGNKFYFDAIRIYDPIDATKDSDMELLYRYDYELDPRIKEVRNILLSSADFESLMGTSEGAVFIDSYKKNSVTVTNPETGKPETIEDPNISINDHYALTVQTYNKVGPKNEVYLAPGQAVAFRLKMHSSAIPVSLDIGAKTV